MRFVHAADLHLDSPLRGLSRLGDGPLAEILRSASRRALENLVQLVLDEQVPLLVLAGDVYDGNWHDYGTGQFFVRQMGRLAEAGVHVVMVSGNHDAESEITRSLRLPTGVRQLDVTAPESIELVDHGVFVHGQGYATKAVLHNLASEYPDRVPGAINIGLLHTNVDGNAGHARYAPCSLDDLRSKGYDYFALGHVHQRAVLQGGEHTIAYSGNLQGRHPRETGPKGALLVEVEAGQPASVEFRDLDVARWERLEVPLQGVADLDQALDATEETLREAVVSAPDRALVVRVVLTGHTPAATALADTDRVREEIDRIGDRTGATVEKIEVAARPADGARSVDAGLLDSIRAGVAARKADHQLLREELRAVEREVGRPLREAGLADLSDQQVLAGILDRAANSLESLVAGGAR